MTAVLPMLTLFRFWPLLASLCGLFSPNSSALPSPTGAASQGTDQQPIELAARYQDVYVTYEELDELLLARHAESKLGRDTRLFMLKLRVVEDLAIELGVSTDAAEIQKMIDEVEKGVQASGSARDIEEFLRLQGVSRAEFLKSLRLAVLQTKLARLGLGIPPGDPVTGEQQEMWLDSKIAERGLEEFPAPWSDNIVLRNGNVTLTRDEFLPFLRKRLADTQLVDLMDGILRVKRMRARMPDLDPDVFTRAVDSEIENRRREVAKDPKYKGLGYEQLLASQGILFDSWRQDPNVVKAALARLWVQRSHDEESLRGVYENERSYFDSEYGEALEAYVLFLRAAEFPNQLIRRDHSKAELELLEIAQTLHSREEFFQAVSSHSEDRASRERKGYLGWVTRTGSSGPSAARGALFGALDGGTLKPTDPADSLTRMVGPVRTETGVLLLWAGDRRPKPSWTAMMLHVHKTLRQRFIDEAVDEAQVITYLQPE
ncbi:MAG: hypothetical protein ACI9F9_000913 [Candidatus Paceibacteria bacterium]|jgi:hypothetical protein